ncbi:hypothetical protein Dda_2494 [Drechslerella dactyloides]|uniref:Uncharacterized protein n=1 Tax=Drechslerella dactyloides TaxID=74499 RepID=A0AAD6J040_DREDA|nr:hypothetical protein Dda_2494 [Drechslerella dactyloides]
MARDTMQFHFINGAAIDADARKQIRSSVMLGRNAGKKRPRREHTNTKPRVLLPDVADAADKTLAPNISDSLSAGTGVASESSGVAAPSNDNLRTTEVARRERTPLYRRVCDDVAIMISPRVVGYDMRKRIAQFFQLGNMIVYPAELCIPFAEAHVLWFEYFQTDDAFFHCLLALAQSHADYLAGSNEDSPITLRHLANSYRCINENLGRQDTPSNSTVASVMSIAMHHNILRTPGGAKIHMDALGRMVELRGGVEAFSFHWMLLQKICRTDLEYSFQSGSQPRFYRDAFPHDFIRATPTWSVCSYEAFVTTTAAQIYNIELQCIYRDILCSSRYLNDTQESPMIAPLDFQEILISVCYRLLRTHPLMEERPANVAEDACHLMLLALMTTMIIRPAHSRLRVSYDLITNLLRHAVCALLESEEDDEFILWVLFAGGVSVFHPQKETWLLSRLGSCTVALGVDSWAAAREILIRFPWVRHFHDKLGEELRNILDTAGLANQLQPLQANTDS